MRITRCTHCKSRKRHRSSLWCRECIKMGHTRAAKAQRLPWYAWRPYLYLDETTDQRALAYLNDALATG